MRAVRAGANQHTEILGGGAVPQRTQGAQVRGPCGAYFALNKSFAFA
jgi:hypothetical protein